MVHCPDDALAAGKEKLRYLPPGCPVSNDNLSH